MSKVRARAAAVCGALVLALTLAGCALLFPSRPVLIGAISLSVQDDQFVYTVCEVDEVRVSYVHLGIDVIDGGQRWGASLLTAENSDGAPVTLAPSQVLVPNAPPPGLDVLTQEPLAASDVRDADVKAFITIDGPDLTVEMAFDDVDVPALLRGEYQYRSGELSSAPCGMGTG